jgi:integrase
VSPIESTETDDRPQAEKILRSRRIEVYAQLGRVDEADRLRGQVEPAELSALFSDFLRAYRGGELAGPKPVAGTVDLYVGHLLGAKGGLLPFAKGFGRTSSAGFDRVLIERWLESERGRGASSDTRRLKLNTARRVGQFAEQHGFISRDSSAGIRAIPKPRPEKGRARTDGVPSEAEIERVLNTFSPPYWADVAELQLRLGLRRSEVLAIGVAWLDERAGVVNVKPGDGFDTKSHEARRIDGVDPETFRLAHHVIDLRRSKGLTTRGYIEAWKRVVAKLEKRGTPWAFRNKSHALRAAYATCSRLAGVPLAVVRDRMGHASERTTEVHYVGRAAGDAPGPFAKRARLVHAEAGKVVALPMRGSKVG